MRIVSQLAACLDDVAEDKVFVVGCTSRSETLDLGLRRSGRFEKEIEIGVPKEEERHQIIQKIV